MKFRNVLKKYFTVSFFSLALVLPFATSAFAAAGDILATAPAIDTADLILAFGAAAGVLMILFAYRKIVKTVNRS